MSDTQSEALEPPAKKSKLPLLIGLVLALVGGGGGFYATWSGMIFAPDEKPGMAKSDIPQRPALDIAYVPVEPLIISLQPNSNSKHLKFRAQLEVASSAKEDVETLMPRVIDVLNSYLWALEPADLENPAALTRMRAQMLRRVQVVTGTGMVNDLLIMEFVLT